MNDKDTRQWSDLAIQLYDKLTGRGAEIVYEFDQFEVSVPSQVGPEAIYTNWKVSGTVKIRTQDQ